MTLGNRRFTQVSFGSADETITVPAPEGGAKGRVAVYGRLTGSAGAGSVRVFGSFASVTETNEVQTLDFGNIADSAVNEQQVINLGDIAAADTYTLTFNAHQTGLITFAADMAAAIQAALIALVDFDPGDLTVAKEAGQTYRVTFAGARAATDVSAITITTVTGFTPVGVTESVKGVVQDSFKLTFNAHESALVNYAADMTSTIEAALIGLSDFVTGDLTVAKTGAATYTVTFDGAFANRDAGAITITSQVGFTATGVTETSKGGSSSEDLTDTATLTTAISEVVTGQENLFPYLTFVFDGDANANLSAEVYAVAF